MMRHSSELWYIMSGCGSVSSSYAFLKASFILMISKLPRPTSFSEVWGAKGEWTRGIALTTIQTWKKDLDSQGLRCSTSQVGILVTTLVRSWKTGEVLAILRHPVFKEHQLLSAGVCGWADVCIYIFFVVKRAAKLIKERSQHFP